MSLSPHPLRRFAAIDIGTVTSRLLVADTDGTCVHVVARDYEITNLGEGVDATGMLLPAALERVGAAVDCFLQVRNQASTPECPVLGTMVVSTSAARDATNAASFVDLLAARGLSAHVITGEQEAALTFAGAAAGATAGAAASAATAAVAATASAATAKARTLAVIDVGGGSTEITFGTASAGITHAHSFDVGCRRATERFLHADPPSPAELQAARTWVRDAFAAWKETLPAHCNGQDSQLIAVAGTATSAISMHQCMRVYDSALVHGAVLTVPELEQLLQRLASLPLDARSQVVGLDSRRAPVIVAGLLILLEAMRVFGWPSFTASESDILQGMILWENAEYSS